MVINLAGGVETRRKPEEFPIASSASPQTEDNMTCGRLLVLYLAAVLGPQPPLVDGHQKALETHKVSVGRFFILKCSPGHTNVTWKRGGSNSSLPAGVEVKDAELWFLPVVQAHDGKYICHNRKERVYEVRVSNELCPAAVESKRMKQGPLHCKLDLPRGTTRTAPVEWLKECVPVNLAGGNLEVTQKGDLRFLRDSETNAGLYTCLLHMSLGDNNYTAARSLNLTLGNTTFLYKPMLVYPKVETKEIVEIGSRKELRCKAYLGNRDDGTNMYWTINGHHFNTSPHLHYSQKYAEEDGAVYGMSSLVISSVVPELLDIPISCHLLNPAGQGQGTFRLHKADHRGLYVCVLAPLTVCLLGLALALGMLFRMELVLAYRRLKRLFISLEVSDGMLYDAYVSYQYSGEGHSSEVVTFALKVLPEVLEKRHGFSLFIRGRDDSPGEALHDVIAEAVSKSRRLVLILSGQETLKHHPPTPAHHNWPTSTAWACTMP
ncbi:interleukin-1 receptor type 1-like [Gadus chalcogrammus]|uniref:interleukin-1 receptor type 1-like n=1 Tax=Gadus chalcogrammus TaxID=1042646 RepID=UPI0024C49DA0|nr:interleukin-1 receptor type 1-like [Gadus chalcogrammus]